MVEEPSHVKQLSPNHGCKIGLKGVSHEVFVLFTDVMEIWAASFCIFERLL
jgi:hypothetical protein